MAEVAWRFTGSGSEHYHGVPARDLTAADYATLTDEQRALVAAGVIYEAVTAPAPPVRVGRRSTADEEAR